VNKQQRSAPKARLCRRNLLPSRLLPPH